jgi:hypothetical protein
MNHHGADGSVHSGPGGMFHCTRCETRESDEPPAELTQLLARLRFRLCDAAFRAHWAKTKRDRGQLRQEAYGYGKAIEDLYAVADVTTLPYAPPRLEGRGLFGAEEQIAREWIGPVSADRILGKRP